jgi:hypothetical protein
MVSCREIIPERNGCPEVPAIVNTSQPTNLPPSCLDAANHQITAVTQDENVTHSQSSVSAPVINNNIQLRDTAANNNNYTIVYHEKTCHYVLSEYCLPVSCKPSVQATIPCKFPYRDCLIARSKCLQTGDQLVDFSPSVYHPNYEKNRKMNHTLLDAQVIKCFVPNCNTTRGGNPKQFHYSCYSHSIENNKDHDTHFIEYMGIDDKLLDLLPDTNKDLKKIVKSFRCNTSKLFFPVCSKRCFKTVVATRKKVVTKLPPSVLANWDKDGINGNRSSISILIDWMTVEGNLSKYFGGLDRNGKTSADRKEAYHNRIRDMIRAENGKYFCYITNITYIYIFSHIYIYIQYQNNVYCHLRDGKKS